MKLEQLMLLKGHTQRSLAKAAKVSDTTINFIINGKGNLTRGTTMKKIADTLGVGIGDIDEFVSAIDTQLGKETAPTSLQPINEVTSGAGSNTGTGVAALIPAQ